MKRQFLSNPSNQDTYDTLFENMSPVPTIYWCAPGNPPTMPLHAAFDDNNYNSERRANREILKGRFGGGSIFYVTEKDLELFACLYKKEITSFSSTQFELMELLTHEGSMNIGTMKEITSTLVKYITPALHKLQEAFLIYEDQLNNEGDREWYVFEHIFPDVDLKRYSKVEALQLAIPRFAYLCVFFDESMLKSYYKLPLKLIKEALLGLVGDKILQAATIEGQTGYMLGADYDILPDENIAPVNPQVLLLQRNDFMVRANADEPKEKFTSQWDTLYYLLIDGVFHGAVMGCFKFGPHVIEDIILDLSDDERELRKEEVLEAVYGVFGRQSCPVGRYCGKILEGGW